jgi:TM2 domain-containing membrane protein YozV
MAEAKNPGLAALLALLVGVGIFGIGHIYVGRIARGLVLAVISIVLDVVLAATLFLTWPYFLVGMLGGATEALGLVLAVDVLLGLVRLVLWVWQTYDAYKLAKQFNAHVQQYGKAPW